MRQWIHEHIIWPLGNLRNRKYIRAEDAVFHAVSKHNDNLMCGQWSEISFDVMNALIDAKIVR